MKTFVSVLMAVSFSLAAYAHDHSAPTPEAAQAKEVTKAEAKDLATTEVKRVAETGKIDSEWAKAPISKVTQVGKTKDWVVQFTRADAKDADKRNLFVVMTSAGAVKAVNYKGIQKMHSHGSGPAHSH
jgi:hypothetical protein